MTREPAARPSGQPWRSLTVAAQTALAVYFIVSNHVPLPPWSTLRTSQRASTLAGVIPILLTMPGFLLNRRRWMMAGTLWAGVWLALQLRQWWLPYLVGPTPLHRDFAWYRVGGYNQTLPPLPPRGDHPRPDAQHLVLQLRSLLTVIVGGLAVAATSPRRHPRG